MLPFSYGKRVPSTHSAKTQSCLDHLVTVSANVNEIFFALNPVPGKVSSHLADSLSISLGHREMQQTVCYAVQVAQVFTEVFFSILAKLDLCRENGIHMDQMHLFTGHLVF
jgi:hypothetical protein